MDLANIATFIMAIAGLITAIVAAYKSREAVERAAKKDDLDALRIIVEGLQEDNALLRQRVRELRDENTLLRIKVDKLQDENDVLTQRLDDYRHEQE